MEPYKLTQLRDQWEKNCTLIAHFENGGQQYSVIEVERKPSKYTLLRYFEIGEAWAVSVDYSDQSAEFAIKMVANIAGGTR